MTIQPPNNDNTSLKSATFTGSIIAMGVGSIILSVAAVGSFVFGGQQSAWGFEYLFCFAAPLPGLFGFLISYSGFSRERNFESRCLISAATGVMVACLAMTFFYSAAISNANREKQSSKNKAETEIAFFKSAIEGKNSNESIKEHYNGFKFSKYDRESIKNLLYENSREKISATSIPVLLEALSEDNEIIGYLVDQPEIPIDIKKAVALYPEARSLANVPMSNNPDTPKEVILLLAANESLEITGNVSFKNKDARPVLGNIYKLHYGYRYFERFGKGATPGPGFSTADEKLAWESVANDKRASTRAWAASSSVAPPSILSKMANDESETIRIFLILNNNTPNEVKRKIAKGFSSSVEELINKFANHSDDRIKVAVANCNETKPATLEELLNSKTDFYRNEVHLAIAKNINTPANALLRLNTFNSRSIDKVLITNPNAPDVLKSKIRHDYPNIDENNNHQINRATQ